MEVLLAAANLALLGTTLAVIAPTEKKAALKIFCHFRAAAETPPTRN
jgi:hypothetical protein